MEDNYRKESLKWWLALDLKAKYQSVLDWKTITTDNRRKQWMYEMISSSDSAIERIYRELILKEAFLN